ncbi:MAG: DUF4270 domain-containing protein [Winogradskyella sp.]|nr:DUF4270 domain-containing protein [Winogradskyella sp.]
MKSFKLSLQNTAAFLLILIAFVACDTDFATIDSDIVNPDNATNFNSQSQDYSIITYNQVVAPVQSNNLAVNMLGYYEDPIYGATTANFVSQLNSSLLDPDFGENVVLDSVVLTIPFFNRTVGVTEENTVDYELDSIFGGIDPMKLSIYESNYFLRTFDPNEEFNTTQAYFSNQSLSVNDPIGDDQLEATLIHVEDTLEVSDEPITLFNTEGEVSLNQPPAIRIKLDTTYWKQKILDLEGETVLSNSNNFYDYFRGIYFKAEPINNKGTFMLLNLASQSANITLHYTKDPFTEGADREQATYVLRFGQVRVNFLKNDYIIPLTNGDDINGDNRLYLKGGEGSKGVIKLFNGDDLDDDQNSLNTFEQWKSEFVDVDENGKFISQKRLINEANLVFYVDQNIVQDNEPNRIFLYDMDNNTPLVDYFLDSQNTVLPSLSVGNHLGILQREDDDPTGKGIKYKLRITEHIKNLLLNDSTNVKLGLTVSSNVNLEGSITQRKVQNSDGTFDSIPISSIITPRGTVLHGNNTTDESKRVYLEIYYTEPENN